MRWNLVSGGKTYSVDLDGDAQPSEDEINQIADHYGLAKDASIEVHKGEVPTQPSTQPTTSGLPIFDPSKVPGFVSPVAAGIGATVGADANLLKKALPSFDWEKPAPKPSVPSTATPNNTGDLGIPQDNLTALGRAMLGKQNATPGQLPFYGGGAQPAPQQPIHPPMSDAEFMARMRGEVPNIVQKAVQTAKKGNQAIKKGMDVGAILGDAAKQDELAYQQRMTAAANPAIAESNQQAEQMAGDVFRPSIGGDYMAGHLQKTLTGGVKGLGALVDFGNIAGSLQKAGVSKEGIGEYLTNMGFLGLSLAGPVTEALTGGMVGAESALGKQVTEATGAAMSTQQGASLATTLLDPHATDEQKAQSAMMLLFLGGMHFGPKIAEGIARKFEPRGNVEVPPTELDNAIAKWKESQRIEESANEPVKPAQATEHPAVENIPTESGFKLQMPGEQGGVPQELWNKIQSRKLLENLHEGSPELEDVFGDKYDPALAKTLHEDWLKGNEPIHHNDISEEHLASIRGTLRDIAESHQVPADDIEHVRHVLEHVDDLAKSSETRDVYDGSKGVRRQEKVVPLNMENSLDFDIYRYALANANDELRYLSPQDIFRYQEERKAPSTKAQSKANRGDKFMRFLGGKTETEFMTKGFGEQESPLDMQDMAKTGTAADVHVPLRVVRSYIKSLKDQIKQSGIESKIREKEAKLRERNNLDLNHEEIGALADKYIANRHLTGQGDWPMPETLKARASEFEKAPSGEQPTATARPATATEPTSRPKEPTKPVAEGEGNFVGSSHRMMQEAEKQGYIQAPERNKGVSPEGMAERGRGTTYEDAIALADRLKKQRAQPDYIEVAGASAKMRAGIRDLKTRIDEARMNLVEAEKAGDTDGRLRYVQEEEALTEKWQHLADTLKATAARDFHEIGTSMQGGLNDAGDWVTVRAKSRANYLRDMGAEMPKEIEAQIKAKYDEFAKKEAEIALREKVVAQREADVNSRQELLDERKQSRNPTRKAALDDEFASLKRDLKKTALFGPSNISGRTRGAVMNPIDPEAARIVAKMVSNRVRRLGVTAAEAIESVVAELRKDGHDVSKEQVTEAYAFAQSEKKLEQAKERTRKATAVYEQRLQDKDFEPKPKQAAYDADPELRQLRLQRDQAKRKLAQEIDRIRKRSFAEKARNAVRTSILSGVGVFGKLATAVAGNGAISHLEELLGPAIEKTVGKFGGLNEAAGTNVKYNPKAELAAIKSYLSKDSWADAWNKLTNKGGELHNRAVALGIDTSIDQVVNPILTFEQNAHSAVKGFAERSAFEREWVKQLAQIQRKGGDINNPDLRLDAFANAYAKSKEAILMNESAASEDLQYALKAKYIGDVLKPFIPIIKVPINIAGRTLEYTGGIPYAAVKQFVNRGKMTPEVAAKVVSAYKRGAVGTGLMLLGANSSEFDTDKEGNLTVDGHAVPKIAVHIPFLEALRMGVLYRKAKQALSKPDDSFTQQMLNIAKASAKSKVQSGIKVARETPFYNVGEMSDSLFGKFYDSPDQSTKRLQQSASKQIASMIIPQISNELAKAFDVKHKPENVGDVLSNIYGTGKKPIRRKQTGSVVDPFKARVPVLREQLPRSGK